MRVQLVDIAHARSGDKGDTANVGLIAALHAAVTAQLPHEMDVSKAVADVAGRHLY